MPSSRVYSIVFPHVAGKGEEEGLRRVEERGRIEEALVTLGCTFSIPETEY